MRSDRSARTDQGVLPFEVATPPRREQAPTPLPSGDPDAPSPRRAARPARPDRPNGPASEGEGPMRCRLRNDAFASRGWPAGTELLVDVRRRPQRGEVALVREGGRLKIGVLERQMGRSALRTDHGVTWLGQSARYVGVVTLVNAPLAGMPELPLPASTA